MKQKIEATNFRVSVVIATYKRSKLLKRCLLGLSRQTIGSDKFEVIVVDDDPKMSAKRVIERLGNQYSKLNLKYIRKGGEQNAEARNAGVKKARSNWIAFIDDDAIPSDTWLESIARLIKEGNVVVVGGPIYPYYQQQKPKWFKDKYEIRSYGNQVKFLNTDEFLSASNLIVWKKAFKEVGEFNVELGIAGKKRGFGEEIKLQRMIRKRYGDKSIGYDPKLEVMHLVTNNKMDLWWLTRARFRAGRYHERIYEDRANIFKMGIKVGISLIKIAARTSEWIVKKPKKNKYFENYWFEEVMNEFYQLGWFWEKIISREL